MIVSGKLPLSLNTLLWSNNGCGCVLQILNPAETFGDIIVDYSYVECTSACITALTAFDRLYPDSQ